MSSVFKISEAASLALHGMVVLARTPDKVMTTEDVALALRASHAHLNKVLQRLTRVGFVKSVKGRRGGFVLGTAPSSISLLDVYEAIEGEIVPTKCLLDKPICGGKCILGGMLQDVNKKVREHLAGIRLSEFAEPPSAKKHPKS
ncbi:MAG: Rrf2 family transcriptional regulator [Planctomycetota bacterium]